MVWRASIGLFLLAAIVGCQWDSQPALRVGANIWPGYEPLYLARRLGYYDEHTVNLVDFPSSVEVMRAYRNGVIDVAALTGDEAISIIASEPGNHNVILVTDFSNGADCVLTQQGFANFEQLKGHRIGVESNALGAYMLLRALQKHGMTVKDVMPISVSLEQHESAFAGKSVDAIVTFEPRCSRLLAAGAHQVFSSKEIPGEVVDVLMVRRTLVDSRMPALSQLVRGWFEALARLEREPRVMAQIAAAHQGVSPDMLLASLQGLKLTDREDNLRLLSKGDGLANTLKVLAHTMREQELLAGELEIANVPDPSIVERTPP